MKKIFFLSFFLIVVLSITANAQNEKKSRKELREERQEQKRQEIKQLLTDTTFVFAATHAMPMGGGSIYLNYSYDIQVESDTVISYLPFYGVAYNVDYGARKSAFDFTQPLENYKMEQEDDGYLITFEVKNRMDNLNFSLHVSELGYTTLNLISVNRQAISYYGRIEPLPEE